jgi:hypothetical protein
LSLAGFNAFQLDGSRERAPWWNGSTRTGERLILTGRIVHQQPEAGLVVSGTVQHVSHERRRSEAGTGPLDFAGYITRTGGLVEVPHSQRDLPEYSDLQVPSMTPSPTYSTTSNASVAVASSGGDSRDYGSVLVSAQPRVRWSGRSSTSARASTTAGR